VYTKVYMSDAFGWDEEKRCRIRATRKFDLLYAARIFKGRVLTQVDERLQYGEIRYISIREVEGEYFVVVHATRPNAVRLITAWRASRRTRQRYQAHFVGRA